MDEGGNIQPAGAIGEVVIRGANVMLGYANNSAANADAFMHGWFRTGDQGYLDRDRKSTRLNSSHIQKSRMPSSA